MSKTAPPRTMTPKEIKALLDGNEGFIIHVETPGGVDYPGGYRSRDHHLVHRYLGRGPDYAYFTVVADNRAFWDTCYEIKNLTRAEVASR